MEGVEVSHDVNVTTKEATESKHSDPKDVPIQISSSPGNYEHNNMVEWKGGEVVSQSVPVDADRSGEVNMEASITTDDVMRAGGFGARDDISSFLPVASDSTDFEASILDARNYEEPQGETCRPGLGWSESAQTK